MRNLILTILVFSLFAAALTYIMIVKPAREQSATEERQRANGAALLKVLGTSE